MAVVALLKLVGKTEVQPPVAHILRGPQVVVTFLDCHPIPDFIALVVAPDTVCFCAGA